jgi:hypothetical protein
MRRSLLLSIALTLTVASPALAEEVKFFYSPSKNISCEVSSGGERGAYAFCQKPRSVTLSEQGTLKVCDGTKCLGDPPRTRSSSATGSPLRSAISSACRRQLACAAASPPPATASS